MLPNTHRILAENLYYEVKTEYGIALNLNRLIYGSIKPDFCLVKKQKHYMDESLEFISDSIIGTMKRPMLDLNKFSAEIGCIFHYITDFFCLPHSEHWNFFASKRTIEHIRYENKLDDFAEVSASRLSKTSSPGVLEDRGEVMAHILDRHEDYKQTRGYRHDILCASSANIAVFSIIINYMMARQLF